MDRILKTVDWEPCIAQRRKAIGRNRKLLPLQRDLILEFADALQRGETLTGKTYRPVGGSATYKYIGLLLHLADYWKKPFEKVTRDDVVTFLNDLRLDKVLRKNGKRYAEGTKMDFKKVIKKFFKWLYVHKLKKRTQFIEIADWVTLTEPKRDPPGLRKEDIDRLITCVPFREKVLIMLLFDTGARIQEFMNLRLGDIENLDMQTLQRRGEYYKIRIRSETSKTQGRTITLFYSTQLLDAWLASHPAKAKGPLTTETQLYPMSYAMIRKTLSKAGKKYLGKRLYPHLLRHSSATHYCMKLKNRWQLCNRFGWTMSSNSVDVYLNRAGITDEEVVKEFEAHSLGDLKGENDKVKERLAFLEEQNKKLAERLQEFAERGESIDRAITGDGELMEKLKAAVLKEMEKGKNAR